MNTRAPVFLIKKAMSNHTIYCPSYLSKTDSNSQLWRLVKAGTASGNTGKEYCPTLDWAAISEGDG
jgi:hypothetical protein